MSQSTKIEHSLNDLIAIARDGKEFYEEAQTKVDDTELSQLFGRIAAVKAEIVSSLSATVESTGGDATSSGTMVGSMQQLYGKVRAAFGDKEYGYVAELEESEDRLLKAFKETIDDDSTPPQAREAARALLPKVQEVHNTMRDRKHAMKRSS